MDVFGLTQESFAATVPFQDATVRIKLLTREKLHVIREAATEQIMDQETKRLIGVYDPDKFDQLLAAEVVEGWDGFTSGDDEFPYSEENCALLMRKWHAFAKFVNDICLDLAQLTEATKEAERKNS